MTTKNQVAKVVRDFRCSKCGVRIKGAKGEDGVVRATNRPYTDSIVEICVCLSCVSP